MSPAEILAQEEEAAGSAEAELVQVASSPIELADWQERARRFMPPLPTGPLTAQQILEREQAKNRAIAELRIPFGTPFDELRTHAYFHLGSLASVRYTGSFLLVDGIVSMEQLKRAEKYLGEILADEKRTPDEKMSATRLIAEMTEARTKLGDHLMGLAEKAEEKSGKSNRRSLPPVAGSTMINVPGENATVVLQNANNGTPRPLPPS